MKNFKYCAYTYRHRQAIRYLIYKLIKDKKTREEMLKRANVHDIDKLMHGKYPYHLQQSLT